MDSELQATYDRFVHFANVQSPHPLDWRRWFDFVELARRYRFEARPSETAVRKLLQRDGFRAESAARLSNFYADACDMFDYLAEEQGLKLRMQHELR